MHTGRIMGIVFEYDMDGIANFRLNDGSKDSLMLPLAEIDFRVLKLLSVYSRY